MRGLSSVLELSIPRTSISLGRLFLALGVALGVLFTDEGSRRGRLVEGGEPETILYERGSQDDDERLLSNQGKSKLLFSR